MFRLLYADNLLQLLHSNEPGAEITTPKRRICAQVTGAPKDFSLRCILQLPVALRIGNASKLDLKDKRRQNTTSKNPPTKKTVRPGKKLNSDPVLKENPASLN
jgi:hypothetical protein